MDVEQLKKDWLAKEKRARTAGKRRYLHFDLPVQYRKKLSQVSDPSWVCRHGFFPLLFDIIETPRFRKVADGEKRVLQKKPREIYYAAHIDSLIYSWYSTLLSAHYEDEIEGKPFASSVLAYRDLGKNNVHFAKDAFQFVSRVGSCCTLAFDISSYFDNLDHHIIKKGWSQILGTSMLPDDHYRVFRSLTRFSYVNKTKLVDSLGSIPQQPDSFRICTMEQFKGIVKGNGLVEVSKKGKGIPQGTPISAVLSNVYMLKFDELLYNYTASINGEYKRYSDDILIVCPIEKRVEVEQFIRNAIDEIKLELNSTKTDITFFSRNSLGQLAGESSHGTKKNLQYLGLEFDGERSFIRSSSLSRYYRKMKASVSEAAKRKNGHHGKDRKIWKRKLYSQYTCLGRKNFPAYVYRAADILESKSCRHQIKGHLEKLNGYIDDSDGKWANKKTGRYSIKYLPEVEMSPEFKEFLKTMEENKFILMWIKKLRNRP